MQQKLADMYKENKVIQLAISPHGDMHTYMHTHTQRHACTYTDKHKSKSRGAITMRQASVRAVRWCYITGWPGTAKHFSVLANNNSIWSTMCACVCGWRGVMKSATWEKD